MRNARVAVSISLAAGSLVFACLGLSAQSASAQTAPAQLQLASAVITAGDDAQVLRPIIIEEQKIIVQGVQLVPQSAPLAKPAKRIGQQMLKLDSAITFEAKLLAYKNLLLKKYKHLVEAANASGHGLVNLMAANFAKRQAALTPLGESLARRFPAATMVLADLAPPAEVAIHLMEKAFQAKGCGGIVCEA
jgi:hypothetical protein